MRRWLVPLAAAVAVILLLGGVWFFAGPGSNSGDDSFAGGGSDVGAGSPGSSGSAEPGDPGTADPGTVPPGDASGSGPAEDPGSGSGDSPSDPMAVVIDSYHLDGDPRRLSVNYTIGVPECYGTIAEPKVEQTARAVTVTLTRIPAKNTGDVACIDIALLKTVDIRLDRQLGDRPVLDGSSGRPVSSGGPAGPPLNSR